MMCIQLNEKSKFENKFLLLWQTFNLFQPFKDIQKRLLFFKTNTHPPWNGAERKRDFIKTIPIVSHIIDVQ